MSRGSVNLTIGGDSTLFWQEILRLEREAPSVIQRSFNEPMERAARRINDATSGIGSLTRAFSRTAAIFGVVGGVVGGAAATFSSLGSSAREAAASQRELMESLRESAREARKAQMDGGDPWAPRRRQIQRDHKERLDAIREEFGTLRGDLPPTGMGRGWKPGAQEAKRRRRDEAVELAEIERDARLKILEDEQKRVEGARLRARQDTENPRRQAIFDAVQAFADEDRGPIEDLIARAGDLREQLRTITDNKDFIGNADQRAAALDQLNEALQRRIALLRKEREEEERQKAIQERYERERARLDAEGIRSDILRLQGREKEADVLDAQIKAQTALARIQKDQSLTDAERERQAALIRQRERLEIRGIEQRANAPASTASIGAGVVGAGAIAQQVFVSGRQRESRETQIASEQLKTQAGIFGEVQRIVELVRYIRDDSTNVARAL